MLKVPKTTSTRLVGTCLALFLCGCSDETPVDPVDINFAPIINWVLGDISEVSPSFILRNSNLVDHSIQFSVSIQVSDEDGLDDISFIFAHHEKHGTYTLEAWGSKQQYKESRNLFTANFYDSQYPHELELSGWEIEVIDAANNRVTESFEFVLPNVEDLGNVKRIVSSYYSDSTYQTEQALRNPTELENSRIDFAVDKLYLTFNNQDDRAKYHEIRFHGNNGQYIGQLESTTELALLPLNTSTEIEYDLTEITYLQGWSGSDIKSFFFVSQDDLTLQDSELHFGMLWWRYRTVSDEIFPTLIY